MGVPSSISDEHRHRASLRRWALGGLLAFGLAASSLAAPALSEEADFDPLQVYGGEILFDIMREGERIGTHKITFTQTPDGVEAKTDISLSVDVLWTTYDFNYRATDRWEEGLLAELDVSLDDDGDEREIKAWRDGANLMVDGPEGELKARGAVVPTTHWNPNVLKGSLVLNTLTGEIHRITLSDLGEEVVRTAQGPVLARHYVYNTDANVETWYDDKGRWVRLRFPGQDGSTIDYFCQRCGISTTESSTAKR